MKILQALRDSALALLFPQENACRLCGRWLGDGKQLCPACQKRLNALRLQWPVPTPPGAPLRQCCAVWQYSGEARPLIYHLKYYGDPAVAQFIGVWMSEAVRDRFQGRIDLLVPVPLHRKRRRERGYNQAVMLAREISLRTGLPVDEEAMRRVRPTATLVHSSRKERLAAMEGVFEAGAEAVSGKRILLIDDVFTTGATSMACAVALLEAGAEDVSVLTACCAGEGDEIAPHASSLSVRPQGGAPR